MAPFVLRRRSPAPPAAVWAVLAELAAYGRWLPLTEVHADPGEPGVGWSFTGLTGVGRLRVHDVMTVTAWQPPSQPGEGGSFAVLKQGRAIGGWAVAVVQPEGAGSAVRWTEEIRLRTPVADAVARPVLARAGALAFGRALDAMLLRAQRDGGLAGGEP
jgi:uncharacterized protein YndB with AHSA1/START domain